MSTAALPMYDLPELQAANDALWAAIATRLQQRGIDAPATLLRGSALEAIWTDPALLLAQTCGYPLMTTLRGKVTLVTTPRYAAPGCDGTFYRSAIIVRTAERAATLADLRGRRCAVNDASSNSGMNVLRAEIARLAPGPAGFFGTMITTGAHTASVSAVAQGDADVAAIDCVTWAHLQRLRPTLTDDLRVLCWTAATPGLPLITAGSASPATLGALLDVLDDVAQDAALAPIRAALVLEGFTRLTPGDYERVLDLERFACAAGYPVLC